MRWPKDVFICPVSVAGVADVKTGQLSHQFASTVAAVTSAQDARPNTPSPKLLPIGRQAVVVVPPRAEGPHRDAPTHREPQTSPDRASGGRGGPERAEGPHRT